MMNRRAKAFYKFSPVAAVCVASVWIAPAFAQSSATVAQTFDVPDQAESTPTPLRDLLDEAERDNPQLIGAQHSWRAATQVPSQVSTLPDPEVTVQQFAVGSPRPFAGFTNSNFAYIGFGASQEIPYPGKLRLRGEAARREADADRYRVESVRRTVMAQVKAAYFQLAYENEELRLLNRDGKLLDQVEQIAEANYRVGEGNQQDVLKAQLEKSKLVAEVETHRQQQLSLQAKLKQVLNRPPSAQGIIPEPLTETPLHITVDELLATVRTQDPDIRRQQEIIRNKSLQLELAHKDFYPDFNVQYMWQHTAEQYRDYYMLTVGARIPIHQSRKQWPEVEQAVEELYSSRRDYEAQIQQTYFDIRDQFLKAETAGRILDIYRQGLIPQAANTFKAGLAAYGNNREDFETLLNSFLDLLKLDEEYWRNLLDHEVALATLQQITGVPLNGSGK
jgi:cobalt-zinc-cadmium efflux system outer membrane protein